MIFLPTVFTLMEQPMRKSIFAFGFQFLAFSSLISIPIILRSEKKTTRKLSYIKENMYFALNFSQFMAAF